MRNKFVYFCTVKIHVSGVDKLLESILCLVLIVEAFSLQKVVEVLEEVVVGWQKIWWIMTDEAKLCTPIHSTFEALVMRLCSQTLSWRKTGPFLLTSVGCRLCSFQCISLIFWPYLSDVTVLPGFRKLCGSEGQQTTKQWPWPFSGASLALGRALEFLPCPAIELVIAGHHIKSTFHCTSQYNQ